ncbi:hypothetical protein C0992_000760, partial [Termitomyces sp. T32_za158]
MIGAPNSLWRSSPTITLPTPPPEYPPSSPTRDITPVSPSPSGTSPHMPRTKPPTTSGPYRSSSGKKSPPPTKPT